MEHLLLGHMEFALGKPAAAWRCRHARDAMHETGPMKHFSPHTFLRKMPDIQIENGQKDYCLPLADTGGFSYQG